MPLKPLDRLQQEKQWFGHWPLVLCNTRLGNFCCQLLTRDYTCLYRRDQFSKMKYGPCRYTGFLTPGQIPNFCSICKYIVIISPHAYRLELLVMDYRHTETFISGTYLTRILVNLKSASKQKHHQKFAGGILVLHKNSLAHNSTFAQAIAEQCEF